MLQKRERHCDKQAEGRENKAETGQREKEGDDQLVHIIFFCNAPSARGNYVIRPPVLGSKSRHARSAMEVRTPASAQPAPTNQGAG